MYLYSSYLHVHKHQLYLLEQPAKHLKFGLQLLGLIKTEGTSLILKSSRPHQPGSVMNA